MSIDDERVLFYLRHHDRIEEWAALRSDVARSMDDWLIKLRPDVERLASELGADVDVLAVIGDEDDYPTFRLARRIWPADAGGPTASIALEWVRRKTTMHNGYVPYVGLRSAKTESISAALRQSEGLRAVKLGRKEKSTDWWVALAYILPGSTFDNSANDYREGLLRALRGAWTAYAPFIDDVVRGMTSHVSFKT